MRIDAHMHIWELGRFGYRWLESVPQLQQDFGLGEGLSTSQQYGIERVVLIEADNSLAETQWLLEITAQNPQVLAVVGWVDAASATLQSDLEVFSQQPKFRGVRVGLWPKTDVSKLGKLLELLQALNLTCDVLMARGELIRLLPVLRQFPNLTFALNHFAGADFTPQNHRAWAKSVAQVADLGKVYMKLSGFMTGGVLEPYLHTALEGFGAERLMFGSDYPVCNLQGDYSFAMGGLEALIPANSAVWGRTAQKVYGG